MAKSIFILMGVSGSGKSTIGRALSSRTGIPFYDADDYHPPANIAKMASGQPLNDADREPWLAQLAQLLQHAASANGAILACSALKTSYRTLLAQHLQQVPRWIYLKGSAALIARRLQARSGHFMPPALLASQFADLEEPTAAQVVSIDQPVEAVVAEILAAGY
ncbi:MAG: gluconate kinase [Bacteroidetes bacterium]|nr:MAG: gluconate kinase [Bacteroidota bacterium]PTM12598.1 MAG: gluconate kinase [Bacteroidota bacterium]